MPTKTTKKPAAHHTATAKSTPMAATHHAAATQTPATGCCGGNGGGCCSGCRCGAGHFIMKLIVIIVIFMLGYVTCCFFGCGRHGGMMDRGGMGMGMGWNRPEMFVNGCLDLSRVRNPEMAQRLASADANGDGCITKDELMAARKAMVSGGQPTGGELPAPTATVE